MLQHNNKVLEEKLSHTHGANAQLRADYEDLEELLEDVVQFIAACLNSRASNTAASVLVAGAESVGRSYQIDGLNFPLPESMYDLIREKLKNLVSCRKPSESTARLVDAEVLMKMVTPVACKINCDALEEQTVLILVVEPRITICEDHLYLVKCGRRQQVYRRLGGGTNHVTGGRVHDLHEELEMKCKISNCNKSAQE